MRALRLYVQRTLNTRRPCDPSFWPSPEIRRLPPSSSHLCFGTSLRKPTCQRRRHRPKLAEVALHSQECSGGPDSSPTSTRVGRVTRARPLVTQPTAASRRFAGRGCFRSCGGMVAVGSMSSTNQQSPSPLGRSPAGDASLDLSWPAHELRAIAASLAWHRGAALSEVIQAVGWTSTTTFGRFYLRNMSSRQTDCVPEDSLRLPAKGGNFSLFCG